MSDFLFFSQINTFKCSFCFCTKLALSVRSTNQTSKNKSKLHLQNKQRIAFTERNAIRYSSRSMLSTKSLLLLQQMFQSVFIMEQNSAVPWTCAKCSALECSFGALTATSATFQMRQWINSWHESDASGRVVQSGSQQVSFFIQPQSEGCGICGSTISAWFQQFAW